MGNNRIVANQRDKFIAENFHELNATETQKYNSMR